MKSLNNKSIYFRYRVSFVVAVFCCALFALAALQNRNPILAPTKSEIASENKAKFHFGGANRSSTVDVSGNATPRNRVRSLGDAEIDLQNDKDIAIHFQQLKSAAMDGDFTAGEALHFALDNCRSVPSKQSTRVNAAGSENSRASLTKYKIENCMHFSESQIHFDIDLVHSLAEQGDNMARVAYSKSALQELDPASADYSQEFEKYAADSLRYLEEAASQGDANALWTLSDAYSDGRIVTADTMKADAYRLSWNYLQLAPADGGLDVEKLLNIADGQLSPTVASDQEARIVQLAKQIISKFRGNQ